MHHILTPRDLRELSPENNPGFALIPQLLGRNASDLLWAAGELADMGYEEFNLNLGCPSGTVTAKRKGAGLLAYPDELDRLLDTIFRLSPIRISIKTRIGMESPEEYAKIMDIYGRYPVARLIVHPRTRSDQYEGPVHLDVFEGILARSSLPVSYNGDLFTVGDVQRFRERFPSVETVMLGRGLIADPAFIVKLRGGCSDRDTLRRFHDTLCEEYARVFGDRNSAMHRMKAIWAHMLPRFPNGEGYRKKLVKARKWEDFRLIADEIFTGYV